MHGWWSIFVETWIIHLLAVITFTIMHKLIKDKLPIEINVGGTAQPKYFSHLFCVLAGSATVVIALQVVFVIWPGLVEREIDEKVVLPLIWINILIPLGAIITSLFTCWRGAWNSYTWGVTAAIATASYGFFGVSLHLLYFGGLSALDHWLFG
ncbi:MAG: hypothetical protein HQL40_00930 [Alphaproteobacteria bacterium]|nr:hypothetical protein [Alphaproteobacteria bacterium]